MNKIIIILLLLFATFGCKKIEPVSAEFTVANYTEYATGIIQTGPVSFLISDMTGIEELEWNFGDGGYSAILNNYVTHNYTSNGAYVVTLTVSNEKYTDTKTVEILIYN